MMDIFVNKIISVSPRKALGCNCSEIYLVGTNIRLPFLSGENNSSLDSKYSLSLKEIRSEVDSISKVSKVVIIKDGEPCIQRMALKSLLTYIKSKGMKVVLETYGAEPNVISYLINKELVDMFKIKAYFPLSESWLTKVNKETLLKNYKGLINDVKKSYDILAKSSMSVMAETILAPEIMEKKRYLKTIVNSISKIHKLRYELVTMKTYLERNNIRVSDDDFISSDSLNKIRKEIEKEYPHIDVVVR